MIVLKSDQELAIMRKAGQIVADAMDVLKEAVRPNLTTLELDAIAERFIRDQGAVPAFKGFRGFPGSICTSINEEVVHGIPGERRLRRGDILSIDIGAVMNGFYADAAFTVPVGIVTEDAARLLEVTLGSLVAGISQARSGNHLSDISHAVQEYVESRGMSVVRDFVGHGIGRSMHEDPQVPNFGEPSRGPVLRPGMTLAIEPMVNLGGFEVTVKEDNWTVVTADGRLSAHFEHTICITGGEAWVLTSKD
jgi:methionyl aminopeptidase